MKSDEDLIFKDTMDIDDKIAEGLYKIAEEAERVTGKKMMICIGTKEEDIISTTVIPSSKTDWKEYRDIGFEMMNSITRFGDCEFGDEDGL
jgi:hypothetical protein